MASLIAFYAALYLLGNVMVGGQRLLEFHPFFYGLLIVVSLSLLFISRLHQFPLVVIMGGGVVVYGVLIFLTSSLRWEDQDATLMLIVELLCLLGAIALSYRLAREQEALEKLIQALILPPLSHKILSAREDIQLIEEEFYRSRRFGYPVSALSVSFDPKQGLLENDLSFQALLNGLQEWIRSRYLLYRLLETVDDHIRKSDLVVCPDENYKLIFICPDTQAENLKALADRLQKQFEEILGIKVRWGIASSSKEAPTFHTLVAKAEEALEGSLSDNKVQSDD
ncbi:MAG: hypothetical protein HPY45_16130 [Anaerolineae bacterium]|nr:hypothetical protein [Anaerolineae bacterium]